MVSWLKRLFCRQPDFVIGSENSPYLRRWWLLPRNPVFNVYLHHFCRSDDDRALHDHPWPSLSIVLSGGYYDITPGIDNTQQRRWCGPGSIIVRRPSSAHRVELARLKLLLASGFSYWSVSQELPAWTLFITGPRVRDWGFLCPRGWVHWQDFTSGVDGSRIGKGCD